MPLCRAPGALIYFSHIPKTGGSSVEAYLARKGVMAMHTERTPCPAMKVTAQHIPRTDADALFPPGFFDASFAVLRDPLERMKSEFRWRASKAKAGRKFLGIGGQPFLRAARRRCPVDFDTWAERMLAAAANDPSIHDNHLRPQVDFVTNEDRLFLFEDGLTPVFRWIDQVTGSAAETDEFWLKRSAAEDVPVTRATRSRIETFFAQDYDLYEQVRVSARAA